MWQCLHSLQEHIAPTYEIRNWGSCTQTDVITWISSSSPHLPLQAKGWCGDSLGWKSKTSKRGAFRIVLKVEREKCDLVSSLVPMPTSLRSCEVLAINRWQYLGSLAPYFCSSVQLKRLQNRSIFKSDISRNISKTGPLEYHGRYS